MKKILSALACLTLISGTYAYANVISPSQFSVGAYGGYGKVSGGYSHDGDIAMGRLALGLQTITWEKIILGAEVGVQSGNSMRLDANSAVMSVIGGLPIQATLKPLVDILITTQFPLLANNPALLGTLKIGGAYRQLQLNNNTSSRDSLQRLNPELQIGIRYQLTQQVKLSAYYQGIYSGSDAGISLASNGDILLRRIPTQQAGFIGIEYSI